MKIGFFMEGEVSQLILTPEDDVEQAILALLKVGARKITVHRGQMYVGRDGAVHSASAGYSVGRDSVYLFLSGAAE